MLKNAIKNWTFLAFANFCDFLRQEFATLLYRFCSLWLCYRVTARDCFFFFWVSRRRFGDVSLSLFLSPSPDPSFQSPVPTSPPKTKTPVVRSRRSWRHHRPPPTTRREREILFQDEAAVRLRHPRPVLRLRQRRLLLRGCQRRVGRVEGISR